MNFSLFSISISSPCGYELKSRYHQRNRRQIIKFEIERIVDFLEDNRSTFTDHECRYLDALIDEYEAKRTPEARHNLKTFLIYMRRCVNSSPEIQTSTNYSLPSDDSITSSSSDDSVTTIIEVKPKVEACQNQFNLKPLSTSHYRFQHNHIRQIIPTILSDTPKSRPRHCRPICAARKQRIPCKCQECLKARRLTCKNSSSSTDSVAQTALKALKSVFGQGKRKALQL